MSTGILGYIAIMAIFFLAAILIEEHLEEKKQRTAKTTKAANAAL